MQKKTSTLVQSPPESRPTNLIRNLLSEESTDLSADGVSAVEKEPPGDHAPPEDYVRVGIWPRD